MSVQVVGLGVVIIVRTFRRFLTSHRHYYRDHKVNICRSKCCPDVVMVRTFRHRHVVVIMSNVISSNGGVVVVMSSNLLSCHCHCHAVTSCHIKREKKRKINT